MASDFAEYCLHVRQLQTKIARCAIWINIPAALLNFILVQTNDLGVLPIHIRSWPVSWAFSLMWLVASGIPLMLLAEFWEMWWNPSARDAYASRSCKVPENVRQGLLEGNRRVVKRTFGIPV